MQIGFSLKPLIDHSAPASVLSDNLTSVFHYLLLAASYFLALKLCLVFTVAPNVIPVLWLHISVLMAALLLLPTASWGYALISVLPAHWFALMLWGVSLPLTFGSFFVSAIEALVGAGAIRMLAGAQFTFEERRHSCLFLVCAVGFAAALGSLIDIKVMRVFGEASGENFWILWRDRYIAHAVTSLAVVPAMVTILQRKTLFPNGATVAKRWEAFALAVWLVMVCALGVIVGGRSLTLDLAVLFGFVPVLVWAAVRFTPTAVALVLCLASLVGIWGAQHWGGPFIGGTATQNVLGVQFFVLLGGGSLLLLAAVISELRTAEALARNNKNQLDLALTAGKLSAWVWDVKPADMPAFIKYVHPDDRPKLEEAIDAALQSNSVFEVELRIAAYGDNSYRWFSSRGLSQRDDDGRPCRMLGVNADIDLQKNSNIQIKRQRDELAHLSRVAMLGEMSGALAHELNQPLTAILSNAQAAQRIQQRLSPERSITAEILGDIISETKRAGDTIQRMRELLKKGETRCVAVDINTIAKQAIALEHSDLITKNIAVKTFFQENLPLVLADSIQVQQVLLNLILNASDAMHDNATSERLIRIVTTRNSETSLLISVSDRGKGVPDNELENIFQPFVTSKSHGLGLGLAICRSIIEAHGGRLWASNNREGGATFNFTLPTASN